jgi:hypothetical protein
VKLTTHLNLVPRSRMRGATSPLPNTPSWCGAQLSTGTTLPLPLRHGGGGLSQEVLLTKLTID